MERGVLKQMNRSLLALAVLAILVAIGTTGVLAAPDASNLLPAYYYSSEGPGQGYIWFPITYDFLNPYNDPTRVGVYPSPFILFPKGEKLDPLGIPPSTPGKEILMMRKDLGLFQQWAEFCSAGKGIHTLWKLIKIGPPPAEGEVLGKHVYFSPNPLDPTGDGTYWYVFNNIYAVKSCTDPIPEGKDPGTIGFWKNWKNHYTLEEITELISLVKQDSGFFPELTADNLSTYLQMGNKNTMAEKARAQLIAAWLNIMSLRLGLQAQVNVSSVADWELIVMGIPDGVLTVEELMNRIKGKWAAGPSNLTTIELEAIKNILDALNNQLLFVN